MCAIVVVPAVVVRPRTTTATESRNYREISGKKRERERAREGKNETKQPGLAQFERKRNLFLILICIRNGGGFWKIQQIAFLPAAERYSF